MNRKYIAVLAGGSVQFKRFIYDMEPEDRKQFIHVDRPEKTMGVEFLTYIRIGSYYTLPKCDELETYIKSRIAMTEEGLHDKSDIAVELAVRDQEIERLKAERDSLKVEKVALCGAIEVIINMTNDTSQEIIDILDHIEFVGKTALDKYKGAS